MKKIIAIALAACLLVALGVGLTMAYLHAQDSKTNTFTVGNVGISLTEPNWVPIDQGGDAAEVYPGEPLAKDPTVTNTGVNPCLVRIEIEWPELPKGSGDIIYRTNYVDNALGADWVEYEGFYYYLKPLATAGDTTPGATATTSALFDQVVIPTGLENGNAETKFDIVVTAYAVQAQGIYPAYSTISGGFAANSPEFYKVVDFFDNAF